MLTALRNGEDLHRLAASGLYGKEASSITPEERKNGKIANFSILYGAGEDKIAEFFKCSKSKAKELLAGYFSKFPLLEHFQKNSFGNSINNGYILIDSLNRRYYIPEIEEYRALTKMCLDQNINPEYKKRLKALKGKIFRDSSNYPIQGEAASMSKYAGMLLRRKSKEYNFKVILLIHDEWILECASNDSERTKKILEQCMDEAAKKFCASVEIRCDAHITKTWSK